MDYKITISVDAENDTNDALKIFPYKFVYEIGGGEIYVFAVYHFHKNPDELNKR